MRSTESAILVDGISKNYTKKKAVVCALKDIKFKVKQGEFAALIGPSGCGKTTTLNILIGVLKPDSGIVKIAGKDVKQARSDGVMGYLFQDPTLLFWRTALENVILPNEICEEDFNRDRAVERGKELLKLVGLGGFENHYPIELSGGMKERVAVARILSHDPEILLMDEPFGALDELTRNTLNLELLRIVEKMSKTVLFVTHSIEEAVFLADKILVMSSSPAIIKDEIHINVPRNKRTQEFKKTKTFLNYETKVRDAL